MIVFFYHLDKCQSVEVSFTAYTYLEQSGNKKPHPKTLNQLERNTVNRRGGINQNKNNKMFRISIIKVAIIFATVISLFSCAKEEQIAPISQSADIELKSKKTDIFLKNGILVFKNKKVFDTTLYKLQRSSAYEFQAFENEYGIKTAFTFFNELVSEDTIMYNTFRKDKNTKDILESMNKGNLPKHSSKVYDAIKSKFVKEVIKENELPTIEMNTSLPCLSMVSNIDGIYAIGDTITQFKNGTLKMITNGDFEKAKKLDDFKVNSEDGTVIVSIQNTTKSTQKAFSNLNGAGTHKLEITLIVSRTSWESNGQVYQRELVYVNTVCSWWGGYPYPYWHAATYPVTSSGNYSYEFTKSGIWYNNTWYKDYTGNSGIDIILYDGTQPYPLYGFLYFHNFYTSVTWGGQAITITFDPNRNYADKVVGLK